MDNIRISIRRYNGSDWNDCSKFSAKTQAKTANGFMNSMVKILNGHRLGSVLLDKYSIASCGGHVGDIRWQGIFYLVNNGRDVKGKIFKHHSHLGEMNYTSPAYLDIVEEEDKEAVEYFKNVMTEIEEREK